MVLRGLTAAFAIVIGSSAAPTIEPRPLPTPLQILASLPVAPESGSGYSREKFKHWIDADGDGCDTRREVLIAESLTPVRVGSGCSLSGGSWFSAYDGQSTTNASSFDVDHLVPLKEAWDSGARTWTAARREAFANDVTHAFALIAVSASSNRSKGDRDPAEWMPTRSQYRCQYAFDWIAVKVTWSLSVDQKEKDALAKILGAC